MSQSAAVSSMTTDVVIRLVGESGEGTVTLGDVAIEMFKDMGLDICTFQTFPAEIKGGTVMYQIRAKSDQAVSHGDGCDVLVALNDEGFDLFGRGLKTPGILLFNSDVFTPVPDPTRTDFALPITTLARKEKEAVRHEVQGEILKRLPAPVNTVGLGALLRLVNAPLDPAEEYLRKTFGRKGEAIVRMNISALHTGASHVAEQIGDKPTPRVYPVARDETVVMVHGNQMTSMGAIAAGIRFFAGYPITPASEIMEFLAKELPTFGGDLIQAEDEIAALGMCLGASYAGQKSMTASSGPGISLMVEQINLAGQAEIPVVIVDVQRGGASTGMPTKTSQGDLNLALYGVHNESPRIVLAPKTVEDCFWTAIEAFNLSEEFQAPALVLTDQMLATRKQTMRPPDLSKIVVVDRQKPTADEREAGYMRYRDTESGVSPMSIPGMRKGAYVSTGIEHDEHDHPAYTPELAAQMKSKRFRKMETLLRVHGHRFVEETGDSGQVDVGIIAFGSTYSAIEEAMALARADGYRVAHQHFRLLSPLPVDATNDFALRCKRILVPELNHSGQFAGWLRHHMDIRFETYHKDEGVPFLASELYAQIIALVNR